MLGLFLHLASFPLWLGLLESVVYFSERLTHRVMKKMSSDMRFTSNVDDVLRNKL